MGNFTQVRFERKTALEHCLVTVDSPVTAAGDKDDLFRTNERYGAFRLSATWGDEASA
jgi:hypothetical protein